MNEREDIVVIGGGVIGVCAAYYLLKEGRKVTILERDKVCSGCSYGNAGLIVPSHSVPLPAPGVVMRALKWMLDPESPFYIRPRLDPKLLSWLWRFRAASSHKRMINSLSVLLEMSRASIGLYDGLINQEGLECSYDRSGTFMLYKTREGYDEALEEANVLEESGLPSRRMAGEEIHEMDGAVRPDIAGGLYYEGDAHLNPSEFVNGLASRVREMGATIQEGVEVVGIDSSGTNELTVRTSTGDYQPEQLVLAAGSWSPGVAAGLRLNLPVQPAKGYSVTFNRPANSPERPMILGEAKVGVNPMGPLMRLAGTLELSGLDLSINPRRVNALVRAVGDYLISDGEGLEAENAWCGLRPVTPDGIPMIGPTERHPNLIVAAGHAMLGMTLGPITGKLVAELACDQTPTADPVPVSPSRFQ